MPKPQSASAGSFESRVLSTRSDYPLREYIGDMAQELAEMARTDGDAVLADLLRSAATRAASFQN